MGSPTRAGRSASDRATSDDIVWCYQMLLGREPETAGQRDYEALIDQGGITREQLVGYFFSSPEFRERLVHSFEWTEGVPVEIAVGDLTYHVSPSDTTVGAELRTMGEYEPHVTAAIRRYLREGQCFADVGASFGYFATLAGSIVGPGGSVFAFEPGPQNQPLLLLNLYKNDIATSGVHHMALSDSAGLVLYSDSGGNGFIGPFTGDPMDLATHTLVRVSTLDHEVGNHQVDMMKIDVEGAEGLVIRGGDALLRRCHPTLIFEFTPAALPAISGITGEALLSNLVDLGYSLDVVTGGSDDRRAHGVDEIMARYEAAEVQHLDLMAWVD